MRYEFESSHVADPGSGRLHVVIRREDSESGQTTADDISFETPADFHVHNDLVAAALLTLVGNQATSVGFNFPISGHCAATLCEFYGLSDAGPVDPGLESRRPGRYVGLNFSGGLDSTAMWLLLREALGSEFRVITTEYGGYFAHEEAGFSAVPRDVSCRTDFRSKGYHRGGRFNSCVTLLFADYLDLAAQTTGHPYTQAPEMVESLRDGLPPRFLRLDLALAAGGLGELHLTRALFSIGPLLLLVALGPERVAGAFAASAPVATEKHVTKGMLLRHAFERLGIDAATWMPETVPPRRPVTWGELMSVDLRVLQIAKRNGHQEAVAICPGFRRFDRAAFDDLSLNFLWRYNTALIGLVPQEIRTRILPIFHRCGIEPFDEQDFAELDRVRTLLAASSVRYDPAPSKPVSRPPAPEPVRPGG